MVIVRLLDEYNQVIGGKLITLPDRPLVGDRIQIGTRCQIVRKVTFTPDLDNQDFTIETETL